jgi:hypothetical protein
MRHINKNGAFGGCGGVVFPKVKTDSRFPAEQAGNQRRRSLAFFLGLQCGKPLASLRMRGVDLDKLGIDRACAPRELHFLEQFGELNVDRLSPWIEIDRLLEVFDGLVAVLR